MWYLHTVKCSSALKMEGIPAICNNMAEPEEHYAT